ncbi:uncharacterized protein [Zea mays]|jgi:hypothetical protein|uniref:Uncharacterized protein n=1 Tax=Zea mays TaxID=4577 RepID=B6U4Y7_MAIZE|nr:uncharacterized protein LOC118476768 [Zea mays]ACG44420.1 hypothetical protein [Zea mays]
MDPVKIILASPLDLEAGGRWRSVRKAASDGELVARFYFTYGGRSVVIGPPRACCVRRSFWTWRRRHTIVDAVKCKRLLPLAGSTDEVDSWGIAVEDSASVESLSTRWTGHAELLRGTVRSNSRPRFRALQGLIIRNLPQQSEC